MDADAYADAFADAYADRCSIEQSVSPPTAPESILVIQTVVLFPVRINLSLET